MCVCVCAFACVSAIEWLLSCEIKVNNAADLQKLLILCSRAWLIITDKFIKHANWKSMSTRGKYFASGQPHVQWQRLTIVMQLTVHQLRCDDGDNDGVNDQQQHNADKDKKKANKHRMQKECRMFREFNRLLWVKLWVMCARLNWWEW